MQIYIRDKTIIKPYSNDLVDSFVRDTEIEAIQVTETKSTFKGHKMPIETVWAQAIGFFLDHPHNEVQLRGYHNPDTGWKLWAYPQTYPCGMSTKELPDHPHFAEDRQQFRDDTLFMSIHHHCSTSAFQSGTDKTDEDNYPGLHITIGKLDKDPLDIHWRFSFAGGYHTIRLSDWFSSNKYPFLDQLPAKYREEIIKDMLVDPSNKAEYPERWTNNLIRPIHQSTYGPSTRTQGQTWHQSQGYWQGDDDYYDGYARTHHKPRSQPRLVTTKKEAKPETIDEIVHSNTDAISATITLLEDNKAYELDINLLPSTRCELYGFADATEMHNILSEDIDTVVLDDFENIIAPLIEAKMIEFVSFGQADQKSILEDLKDASFILADTDSMEAIEDALYALEVANEIAALEMENTTPM